MTGKKSHFANFYRLIFPFPSRFSFSPTDNSWGGGQNPPIPEYASIQEAVCTQFSPKLRRKKNNLSTHSVAGKVTKFKHKEIEKKSKQSLKTYFLASKLAYNILYVQEVLSNYDGTHSITMIRLLYVHKFSI